MSLFFVLIGLTWASFGVYGWFRDFHDHIYTRMDLIWLPTCIFIGPLSLLLGDYPEES